MMERIGNKIGELSASIISNGAGLIEGLYPLFVIVCIIGLFLNMAGVEKKGKQISSMSFLLYLIMKVISSV